MTLPLMEPELLEHLRIEFEEHGVRAADFFESAQQHLDSPRDDRPRLGERIAYCCREALVSITKAGGPSFSSPWRELSREVVTAASRYELAAQLHSDDTDQLRSELFRRARELARFHEEGESVHEKRLIAVIVERAGVPPSEGSGVISVFHGLLERLNQALHGDCALEEAQVMWQGCVALVRQMFLPAVLRQEELTRLAGIAEPSDGDVEELRGLIGTPVHLQQFMRLVTSPSWLLRLDEKGFFDAEPVDVWWAIANAAQRLCELHPDKITEWLVDLWERNRESLERVRCIANAARRIGQPGAELLRRILQRHQGDSGVVFEAMQAALELDASDEMVARFADLLFNPANWQYLYVPQRLAELLAAGIGEDNARERVEVLCFKLKSTPANDHLLMRLRWDPTGSIANLEERRLQERSQVLANCLVSALRRAWLSMPLSEILDLVSMLPDGLRVRTRAWLLAEVPDLSEEQLVSEIEEAVRSRWPNGDDVAMLNRVSGTNISGSSANRLRNAFGEPPPDTETTRAVADGDVPSEWTRTSQWALLLSQDIVGPWAVTAQQLLPRFAASGPQQLTHRPQGEAFISTSPYTAEALAALPPLQACELIAAWRPGPSDWNHDPHQLGNALQSVVQDAPGAWLSDPLSVAVKLRHPTYISSYLRAVKEITADHPVPAAAILDVIGLVHANPWTPDTLSDDVLDYDADWREAKRASMELIGAMASADIDLGDRADEAWTLIGAAAHDRSEGSGFTSEMDPLTNAINRPCTRAFETALLVVAAELRAGKPLRPEYTDLLDFALRLEGTDGAEYRAILARRLGWLRHALPDWFNNNIELLMGDEAPAGLAQITVDLTLHWDRSDRWLLESFPEMVKDAVLRDTAEAMDHFMVAMLWDCEGYQIDDTVQFIEQHLDEYPELASRAGERISHIVSHEGTEQRYLESAVQFWDALLNSRAAPKLGGFGSMYLVSALDDERWAQLTRRTLEATADRGFWLHGATDRAMELPPTRAKLAVLNAIVRGHLEPWERYHIAEHINLVLQNATELESTVEHRQLTTALREHDIIRDEPEEDS